MALPSLDHCGELVRVADPDRFLTGVTAPPDRRADLFALYVFNVEVAKTREAVSEPMLGQIRLQWWREAVEECFSGTPRRHWVVEALAQAVRTHDLPRELFDRLIDARESDLDSAPPTVLADFETYCRETSGTLSMLAAQVLGATSAETLTAAEKVGTAWAMIGTVRALPFALQRKDWTLPADVMDSHGVDRQQLGRLKSSPELAEAVRSLLERARAVLRDARTYKAEKAAVPALLLARLGDVYLGQVRRAGCDPFDPRVAAQPARRSLAVAWGAWTGRW